MGAIVVCGGGAVGLSVAVTLARDGHDVTVLEADPDGAPATPDAAWASWRRHGVAQFHQPHILLPRFREVLDRELPGHTDALLAAGCVASSALGTPPPAITDRAPRPGDERLRFVTGRRPVVESALAARAEEEPRLTVRRGAWAAGLLAGPEAVPGVPHAGGVRTEDGEDLPADLVVDATGRWTPSATWLAGPGARPAVVTSQDCGFAYYTRYFAGPRRPPLTGPPVAAFDGFSLLSLDGDNGTWSLTIFALSGDSPLKALRGTVADHLDEPARFALAWDEVTERAVAPFFRAQLAADGQRIGELPAVAAGREPPPPDPMTHFAAAAMHDPLLFRALVETTSCLAPPDEVLARPEVQERLAVVGEVAPLRLPGPDRARLLDLLAA